MTMILTSLNHYLVLISVLINLSSTYKRMSLDGSTLCSPITTRVVKLETESLSGLIVSLGRLKDHSLSWEKNFICRFKVQTQHYHGLFIVIQDIVFRKNASSNECIDYVQYQRADRTMSRKYCGRLNATLGMDRIFAQEATFLEPTINSFIDHTGMVDVRIHISREPLKTQEEMKLEIAFTSFLRCRQNKKDYHECSSTYKDYCIYKDFFGDFFVNCPYPDCVDEGGCSEKVYQSQGSVGNKIVIGSVTSLFALFVLFICCIWLCRKYKKLCWSDDFSTPSNTNHNTSNPDTNESSTHNISMASTTRVVGSSAGTNVNNEEDKDLPPTYDSLFPNR